MAQKTFPQYEQIETIDDNGLLLIDSGIVTNKATTKQFKDYCVADVEQEMEDLDDSVDTRLLELETKFNQALRLARGVGPSNLTLRTASQANEWRSICNAGGNLVAVSIGGTNRVMTSNDGITWINRSAAAANTWVAVEYNSYLGDVVAVSEAGTNRVMRSTDNGVTWASISCPASAWAAICFSDTTGLWVAVGSSAVMTSPDGTAWTARTAISGNWTSVCWDSNNAVFVAVSGTNTCMTSPDGITWTSRGSAGTLASAIQVVYAPKLKAVVAISSNYSSNGTSGTRISKDGGLTWTSGFPQLTRIRSIAWSEEIGVFIAFAGDTGFGNDNRYAFSADGSSWTTKLIPQANYWGAVCFHEQLGQFVAVSRDGTNRVLTSLNIKPVAGVLA